MASIVELVSCRTCTTVYSGAACPRCVRPLRPEDVAGYATLPVPPEQSGNPNWQEGPDLRGHRVRDGKCVNKGCAYRLTDVPDDMEPELRATFLAGVQAQRRAKLERGVVEEEDRCIWATARCDCVLPQTCSACEDAS